MDDIHIVFDIGGTKMRVAAASAETLEEPLKVSTPADPKVAIAELARMAQEAAKGRRIAGAAGGSRWIISNGIFMPGDPALPGWGRFPLVPEMESAFGASINIVHDTAAVGLGEVHFGAAKGSSICAYVTVSTGVGGDRIVDGHVDRATYNFEIGHQYINGETLENQVSGTAVKKKFGIEPKDFSSEEERNKLADILGMGLYHTALYWSPDTIVLGGSMIVGTNPIPLARTEEKMNSLLTMFPKPPKLVMAALGDLGGLHGGRALALDTAHA